jgi:homopolymeric O-antigen transport system permease protein
MSTISPPLKAAEPRSLSSPRRDVFRIEPSRNGSVVRYAELWEFREVLYFIIWRDIKIRYKQTVLGLAWAVLQPAATILIFSVVFGYLARIQSDGAPYAVFALAGLLPWNFFQSGLSQGANSLVGNSNLLTKVYFPRVLLPLANVATGLVDFGFALLVLFALMAFYGVAPSLRLLLLPFPLLLAMVASLGAGLWLAALNVRYRDVRHTIPFLLQIWMYSTPIVYPASLIPDDLRTLFALNPMVSVAEWFRWSILGTETLTAGMVLASCITAAVLLVSGARYFRSMERTFADVI